MVDRIDMSLDDIIKKDRIPRSRPGRGNKFAGRVRPAGSSRAAGGGAGGRGAGAKAGAKGAKRTVVKKVGAVRQSVKTKAPLRKSTTSNTRRTTASSGSSSWKNDKISALQVDLRSPVLEINNLHYNVSDGDLKELFREFGVIKKVSVLYDASGRSVGKAEISFTTVTAANNAMKKYNGVSLDGRAMAICPKVSNIVKASIASRLGKPNVVQPKTSNNARSNTKQSNSSSNRRSNNTGRGGGQSSSNRGQSSSRGGRGGARGGRGGNRNSRTPKKEVTREELDRDLESYIQRT